MGCEGALEKIHNGCQLAPCRTKFSKTWWPQATMFLRILPPIKSRLKKKAFLHWKIFHSRVENFPLQDGKFSALGRKIFHTGFYKENFKRCVENFPHTFNPLSAVSHTLFEIFLTKTSVENYLHCQKIVHCIVEKTWKIQKNIFVLKTLHWHPRNRF